MGQPLRNQGGRWVVKHAVGRYQLSNISFGPCKKHRHVGNKTIYTDDHVPFNKGALPLKCVDTTYQSLEDHAPGRRFWNWVQGPRTPIPIPHLCQIRHRWGRCRGRNALRQSRGRNAHRLRACLTRPYWVPLFHNKRFQFNDVVLNDHHRKSTFILEVKVINGVVVTHLGILHLSSVGRGD